MTHDAERAVGFRIAIGSDDAGLDYKEVLKADLGADGRVSRLLDLGVFASAPADRSYPFIARRAAELVASGEIDRAVLVCGTGIGMAIGANKVRGVHATVAHDSYSVERSVLSNNCQIITLGQRVVGLQLARRLVSEWLGYTFDTSSPSAAKVELIDQFDQRGRLQP